MSDKDDKEIWFGLHSEEEAKAAGECVTILAGLRYRTAGLRVAKYLEQLFDRPPVSN